MRDVSEKDSVGGAMGGGIQCSSRRDLLLEVKCSSRSGDGKYREGKICSERCGVVWYVHWVGERSRIKPEHHPQ